jgi:hypothetical protein
MLDDVERDYQQEQKVGRRKLQNQKVVVVFQHASLSQDSYNDQNVGENSKDENRDPNMDVI